MSKERELVYANKINGTETGIIDVVSKKIYCLCPKEVAYEILKSLQGYDRCIKRIHKIWHTDVELYNTITKILKEELTK